MTLKERAKLLKAMTPETQRILRQTAKDATLRAVEKAADLTPPTADDLAGTNTRSGEMKQHWMTDSVVEPKGRGTNLVTVLANDKQYASYVNDGHRMDRHFVPGLYINPDSGLLERNPDGSGGLVVGTKTEYVEGLYMTEEAVKEYRRVLKVGLDKKLPEVFK